MVWLLYLICSLSCSIETFVNLSKGALFYSKTVKGIFAIIHWIILIALCIIAIVKFSWWHILCLISLDIFTGWFIGFMIIKYLYKGNKD